MRISDWSSDVCSSDLIDGVVDAVTIVLTVFEDRLFGGTLPTKYGIARIQFFLGFGHQSRAPFLNDVLIAFDERASEALISGESLLIVRMGDRKSTRLNSSH